MVLPTPDYEVLSAAISRAAVAQALQPLPAFLEKTIQLYEMIVVGGRGMCHCVGGGNGFCPLMDVSLVTRGTAELRMAEPLSPLHRCGTA